MLQVTQVTNQFLHATSWENLDQIEDDGRLRPSRCSSKFFDGRLSEPDAPTGIWFNANNFRGMPPSKTPYPERLLKRDVPIVPGLLVDVDILLSEQSVLDTTAQWQLFLVSKTQRSYL